MPSFIPLVSGGVRDSAVGRATRYGLDSPGIEPRWCQTGPEDHQASCTVGTGYFFGVKRPKRGADHSSPSSVVLRISWDKVKQSLYRPGRALGFQKVEAPRNSRHSAQEDDKVVSPTHRLPSATADIPFTHVNPRAIVPTFRHVAQCLSRLRHRLQHVME